MILDDWRYRAYHVVTLAGIPLLQLAVYPSLFVTPGGNQSIDPWVYVGFSLSLPAHLQRFGETYYASRLSWIVPGFIAHRLFPPLVAEYVLHLAFFYALLAATYMLVARAVNRSAAMLAALLVAWEPAILGAMSWDYVDGAGIAFLVVTLLCLEGAAGPRRTVAWSVAAGVAGACAIVTNLVLLGLMPACIVFLWLRAGPKRRNVIVRTVAAATAGAVATLILFAIVNKSLGGPWLFLAGSIRIVTGFYGHASSWRVPFLVFDWARHSWLVLPSIAGLGALASLAAPPTGQSSFARAVQVTALVAIGTWLVSDLVMRSNFLQYGYYVSYLVPFAVLALLLQAPALQPTGRLSAIVALELVTLAVLEISHMVLTSNGGALWRDLVFYARPRPLLDEKFVLMSVATAAGLVAALALRLLRPFRLAWGAFIVAMACTYVAAWRYVPIEMDRRGDFLDTVSAHRFIAKNVGEREVRFWSCHPSLYSPPFQSISSTYLWGYVLLNDQFPALTEAQAAVLRSDTRLVLLLNPHDETDDARNALRHFGYDISVVAQEEFGMPQRPFRVVVADLVRRPAA